MPKEVMNAVATDAFIQAQEGVAVPLDPDQADALAAFMEEALLAEMQQQFHLKAKPPARAVVGTWRFRPDVQPNPRRTR